MNKVVCANQKEPHFFDADKYTVCPHCGAPKRPDNWETENNQEKEQKISTEKSKKKGFFWKSSKREESNTDNKEIGNSISATGDVTLVAGKKKELDIQVAEELSVSAEEVKGSIPETEVLIKSFWSEEEKETQSFDNRPTQKQSVNKQITLDDVKTETIHTFKRTGTGQNVGERNEGGLNKPDTRIEPVVGWLVCVEGKYKGCSFSLKTGINVIGRNEDADICLREDGMVSRHKHAVIIYEPKQKEFIACQGETSMTYYNEELLFGQQKLKAYDALEIGEGNYLFIPFCGEQFDWSMNKMQEEK